MKKKKFNIDDYNRKGFLKPGLGVSVIVFFYSRFLLYGPISLTGALSRNSIPLDFSFITNTHPRLMISSIRPVILLFLLFSKSAKTPRLLRLFWTHGRGIIISTIVIQLVLSAYFNFISKPIHVSIIIEMLIQLFFLYIVASSFRIATVFGSFPSDPR